ncbi:transcription factor [Ganoderma sinense ZZ0214-1]|uniref:Transcription factor n=1 Tax=Ganoderma sinense ZZ0214-1 TaxID=1077348 RepID=A0A2G8RPF7_9APHY|nr:transcription factor [Ganoderma sinense ZZ0214-1]
MDCTSFYTYGTETLSSSFKDWVGVPGSPSASHQARMDLDDEPATISSFDQDIDDALGLPFDVFGPLDVSYQPDLEIDWQSLFNTTMPFPPAAFTDDSYSTSDSFNQPLSPVSDTTLVDSAFPPFQPDFKLPPAGDVLVDQPVASLCSAFDDFQFTFRCESAATIPPLDFSPPQLEQHYYQDNYGCRQGQYWPGQQPSQHEVGAAGAVVPGLATGVEVNADAFAFTAMGPTLLPPLPAASPEPQQIDSPINTNKNALPARAVPKKKQPRVDSDADSNYSASESSSGDDTPAPPRKRRKQDTTKRYRCLHPECDAAFSRTYNLRVHINSVHEKKRSFACEEDGCMRAFSRKHDLVRHHQSAHTDLGSPRNANNAKGAKGGEARKKDKLDV